MTTEDLRITFASYDLAAGDVPEIRGTIMVNLTEQDLMESFAEQQEFDLVIFHGNCFDGFAAAWAARKHSPNATFVPAQYGDIPPSVTGLRVLICDFSYPRDILLQMHADAASLLVLDHHKTAAQDLEGLDFAIFDMDRSGAGITWDTLHPEGRPLFIDFVEDRDLWRFRRPESRVFHAAMTLLPFEFDAWDRQLLRPLSEVLAEGKLILDFTQQKAAGLASRARHVMLDGTHHVWAVNAPVEFVGETADILLSRLPHLPVLAWSWDGERNNVYCSLRSRDDGPDVSAIARTFGGGGHEHAAGFRTQLNSLHGLLGI